MLNCDLEQLGQFMLDNPQYNVFYNGGRVIGAVKPDNEDEHVLIFNDGDTMRYLSATYLNVSGFEMTKNVNFHSVVLGWADDDPTPK